MKILLVDDNLSLTTLLSRALNRLGYQVTAENDSDRAIRTIQKLRPDLIILDLEMPGKSGLEIYGELKISSQLASIPVIMLASLDDAGSVRSEVFGCDVLRKPAGLDDLLTVIEKNLLHHNSDHVDRDIHPTHSNSKKREVYENILQ